MVVDFLELKTETDPEVINTSGSVKISSAKVRRKINFPILGFELEAERFISSELPIQNPIKKSGSNFLRHTHPKKYF